jgi:hypothetical protein
MQIVCTLQARNAAPFWIAKYIKHAAAYAAERLVLQEFFFKLKVRKSGL